MQAVGFLLRCAPLGMTGFLLRCVRVGMTRVRARPVSLSPIQPAPPDASKAFLPIL
jgi:hypothetical protein